MQEYRTKTALLGLGIMGQAIGDRLVDEGYALTVWNRTASKTQSLAMRGAGVAVTPEEAARDAKVIVLCLTDAAATEAVVFGPHGVAQATQTGAVVLDVATIGVDATRRLAGRFARATGAEWIDGPVSGGPAAARSGSLVMFCGGSTDALGLAEPIVRSLTRSSTHMGSIGAGQATKLCNQLIVSATMLAIAEAVALAEAMGLRADRLPHALAGGYADSLPLQIFAPRMVTQQLEPRISEVATMRKDVKSLLAASASLPLRLALTQRVDELYDLAVEQGLEHADLGALPRLTRM